MEFKNLIQASGNQHEVSLKASPPLTLAPSSKKSSCLVAFSQVPALHFDSVGIPIVLFFSLVL